MRAGTRIKVGNEVWEKQKIPKEYDLEEKIIEFSKKQHRSNSLFCYCRGGFGSFWKCSGTMILGDFYPSLEEAIKKENGHIGNTRNFPIYQYVKIQG